MFEQGLDRPQAKSDGDASTKGRPVESVGKRTLVATAYDDGLVDPFMAANWNDTMFWTLARKHGLPGSAPPEVAGEIDRWLTGFDLSSGDRRIIHLAAAVMSGAIDARLFRNLPAIGPALGFLQDVEDVQVRLAQYRGLGDGAGQLLTLARTGLGAIRARTAGVQGVVSPLATLASAIHFAINTAGVAATAGTGGAAAPGAVVASAAAAGLNTFTEVLSKIVDGSLLAFDSIDGFLSIIELGNAAAGAKQAEAHAQFDRAAEYRSIMRGLAVDGFFAGMKLALDGGMFLFGLVEAPIDALGGLPLGFLVSPPADAVGDAIDGAGELASLLNDSIGDEVLGAMDLGIPGLSFGDALRSPTPPVSSAPASGDPLLDGLRGATVATSIASHAAAHGDRPAWHQPLLDAILAGPIGETPDRLRPSWYLEQIARALRRGITGASATTIDGFGAMLDQLGANLQPAFDLAVVGIDGWLAANLPKLQKLATDVNAQLQQTRVDLAGARHVVGELQRMTGVARGASITARAVALALRGQLLGALDGLSIDLPPVLDGLEAQWNQRVTELRTWVTDLSDRIIADVEAAILAVIADLERRLAMLQQQLIAGGAVETELQATYAEVKALADRATTAFVGWQPVVGRLDVTGAGTWLRSLAAQWRTGLAIEHGLAADPWRTSIVPSIAQPQVAAWKASHGLDLERAFYPAMPVAELAACAKVYQRGVQATQTMPAAAGAVARAALDAAYDRVTELANARGVDALRQLWSREEQLVMLVRGLDVVT